MRIPLIGQAAFATGPLFHLFVLFGRFVSPSCHTRRQCNRAFAVAVWNTPLSEPHPGWAQGDASLGPMRKKSPTELSSPVQRTL